MSSIIEQTPLVPVIHKSEFDDVAAKFLTAYCPEALETPMPVPIMNIARKKLGLIVCTKYRLSEDFSILGQMCFNSGYVDVYLKDTDEYIQLTVRRGTMFIDPDVTELRNEGCFNNTVAHECVHWYKHRNYQRNINALLPNRMNVFRTNGQTRIGWSGRQTESRQEYLCRKRCSSRRRRIFVRNCLKSTTPMF